jgi:hypothetical protein
MRRNRSNRGFKTQDTGNVKRGEEARVVLVGAWHEIYRHCRSILSFFRTNFDTLRRSKRGGTRPPSSPRKSPTVDRPPMERSVPCVL